LGAGGRNGAGAERIRCGNSGVALRFSSANGASSRSHQKQSESTHQGKFDTSSPISVDRQLPQRYNDQNDKGNAMQIRFVLKGVAVLALVYAGTPGFAVDTTAYKEKLKAATAAYWSAHADMLQELKADRPDNQASEDLYQAAIALWRKTAENLGRLGTDVTQIADQPQKFKCSSSWEAIIDAMDRAYATLKQEWDTDYPDKETAERAYQIAYRRWSDALHRTGYTITGPKWYPPPFRHFWRLPPTYPAPPPVNAPPNN
jgi:hypothetical protein